MGKKLVIVESPTKAKTISRYLGPGYQVLSTVGHVRDLPKSSLGVDPEHGFLPDYQVITGKAKTIKALKDSAKEADEIFLAPDPDREGEAIAWHVAEILRKPVKRIEFQEVTKRAILESLKHPREIDVDRVNAQQARRVLDRLVGYSISPLMWRKIKPGLSAGRVQSVAVRLICERESEIRAFKPQEYWSFEGQFSCGGQSFAASLVRIGDKRLARPAAEGEEPRRDEEGDSAATGGSITISSAEQAEKLAAEARAQSYVMGEVTRRRTSRRPGAPFTTSSMQQEAARKLGWTARKAMQVAQSLYEGVDVGSGSEGLITYMRTDSVRVSTEALDSVRDAIGGRFGADYLPEKPNFYKSKSDAQEAHEAIRPTDMQRPPESIERYLNADQIKLYRLIYNRFLASQMKPAEFETASVELSGGAYTFRASATVTTFRGFMAAYGDEREGEPAAIPNQPAGSKASLDELKSSQHFTKAPPRFTDATLVKALEDNGIGRPSTYAAIIETIIARGYVVRVQRAFEPTEWGFVTTEMLTHYFPDIVDIGFTRDMEEKLDEVEEGRQDWRQLLGSFYTPFKHKIDEAAGEKRYFKAKPFETDVMCDKCGAVMVLRHGKFGRFLSCSTYPKCSNIKNLDDKGNIIEKVSSEQGQEAGRPCPKCGKGLVVKVSRWGTKFLGCSGYPKCDFTSELQTTCPKCGGTLIRKQLPSRKVIYVCENVPDTAADGTVTAAKGKAGDKNCDFVLWGKPLLETCPLCGFWLAEQKIRGTDRWKRYCPNVACANHKGFSEDSEGEEEAEAEADGLTEVSSE
ncbi:type I DNA topoisomerase [bacterium]|nr:type I DNA topoisomerase [bacterium]